MKNIIEIEKLVKIYDGVTAVEELDLSVQKGEMFGLVGPDGAGKTTTIRILCGLIPKDSGKTELFGMDISENPNEIQKKIGYLSQKFSLYGDLTIDENIEFFAEIHNVKDYEERRNELLEFTRLTKFRNRLADNLSGGMKQKLALACSLIHKPEILFLDEPTTGVDPVSRRDFWKILAELLKGGITIIMTTPYLDEAERCSRVALMDKGKIIAVDKPDEIKNSLSIDFVEIICKPVKKAYSILKDEMNLETQIFGDRLNIGLENCEIKMPEIIKNLEERNVEIISKRKITPNLENVFIHLIKEAS